MQRDQAHRTNELLERIAIALEKNNKKESIHPVDKLQGGDDIPGFEGTKDALDNLTSDFHNYLGTSNKELHELKLHTDEGQSCGDDHVHNDYLNDLVQEMTKEQYIAFCQEMSYVNYDLKVVQHSLYELEYEECLGAIKQALAIIGDNADDPNLEVQLNQDKYTYEHDEPGNEYSPLVEYHCGVINDSDFNLRKTAKMYTDILNGTHATYRDGDEGVYLRTKKDCILDYVTNEFGILGARYTDIIKFAYYLGCPNAPKYSNANRGYYSCAFSSRMNGHLIQGGKDCLVKGINNEGKEKYFALSFVDQATNYWKRIS